ncbi:tctex1 domain-containing protein 2 isoform X2 [Neophocaena asiaeorientalis asiaeorientalis]|uniref:Tctex1 domain-containing protein 2 isoform X2 n=1 Tax=Neophocaena asiaeorientalis asiaeorientalis TaxID=1706337 RepID=A0A341C0G8_NEOAA|nr:tctex1 domain-containing protein 2 isoform X2 [Neophocaena asiaeorientalis asiaeorientalis]XP_032487581.1 tctex1 domain-containing protein 2 isoform X2 [Phocoena sinus]
MSVAASFSMPTSFSAVEGLPETEKNAGESENTYILRPIFQQRFRPSVVRDCIHAVLKEELANAEYSPEEMPQLTKRLSENIKDKLKEMGFDRYKMVVQVVIGEQRGEGVFSPFCLEHSPSDLSMKNLECSLEPQPQQHGYSLFLGC